MTTKLDIAMRVLISGAGIAGSTLAWFLAKNGARVTVLEKASALLPHGQNVDIQGTARQVVRMMGLTEEVLRRNTTEKGTKFIDPKGRPFAPFPVQKGASAVSMTSPYEILRADLAAIFYEAARDYPNVDYQFGTTVKRVISNDDRSVKVESSNGDVEEYDLLVAADGQWSKVRKQCFSPDSIDVIFRNMIAVYWTIPRVPSDDDWWNVYQALGSKIITLRPDPYGTIRAMLCRMPRNEAEKKEWLDAAKSDKKAQRDFLRKEFGNAGWQSQRLLDAMEEAPDFYFHVIEQIKMAKWSSNRVICLGDAAYAPSPLTGMGTSLAITGPYVLAGELSKLKPGESPTNALETYERTFRPFVDKVQDIPSWVPGVAYAETEIRRWIFSTFISTISRIASIPWVAKKFGDDGDQNDFPLPQYSTLNLETQSQEKLGS